jgi:hypothetical protein
MVYKYNYGDLQIQSLVYIFIARESNSLNFLFFG